MNYSKYQLNPLRMDEEDPDEKEPKEDKGPEMGMLNKKLEKYFFENRTVELWGAVDDKTAREVHPEITGKVVGQQKNREKKVNTSKSS